MYVNLANFTLALQRFDEARQAIHEAQARKQDNFILHNALYALAFLGADSAGDGGTATVVCGQAGLLRTLGWRSHPTPRRMLVMSARRGN